MKTTIIQHQQGSDAWHQHRASHLNASDCSAAMGLSSYKTRSQLLHEKATGITPEIDAQTQKRFDRGHEFEAIARPWAEEILDDNDLFPVVLAGEFEGLNLSASLDGLTMGRPGISFEHKSGNAALLASLERGIIPDQYHPQMEMGLMLSGAEKCMFMASSGDRDAMRWAWYLPNPDLRAKIIATWHQFNADLAAYSPIETVATPVGRTPETLPALHIEVTGMVTASNLAEYKAHALAVFASINRELVTDAHFADAEKTVKWCGDIETRLAAAKQHALSQTASIDQLFKTIDDISAEARATRLELDKLVKNRKDSIRSEIVADGRTAMIDHIAALNKRIGSALMPAIAYDFANAIKGKRTLDSMRDAVSTELARAKIEANATADRITVNLRKLDENPHLYFLFSDSAQLVLKAPEDLAAVVQNRISAHEAKEAARLAAETARIAEQERVKAEAAAQARANAEIAEAAKAQREAQAEEDSLIAGIWTQARRIEGDRIGYIQKAIGYFEAGPADFANDPRPRVAEAVSAARQEMNAKLTAATLREQEASDAALAATQAIEAAKNPEPQTAAVPFATVVDLMPESVREAMKPETPAVYVPHFATAPDLKLGQICTRLGFQVSADFLKSLGFEPAGRERAAVLFHESDFPRICSALVRHINKVLQGVPA